MPLPLKPWNWQQDDWPDFTFQESALRDLEAAFLRLSGIHVGTLSHLTSDDEEAVRSELLSEEALETSKIEGEYLDRDSLQSSIRKLFGLQEISQPTAAEEGISELQVDRYRNFSAPLSDEMLFQWHRMVMKGRWDLKVTGDYRHDETPMQIVSGPIHDPVVHFEAPPSALIKGEMRKFIDWFNDSTKRPALESPTSGLNRFIPSRTAMAGLDGRLRRSLFPNRSVSRL